MSRMRVQMHGILLYECRGAQAFDSFHVYTFIYIFIYKRLCYYLLPLCANATECNAYINTLHQIHTAEQRVHGYLQLAF